MSRLTYAQRKAFVIALLVFVTIVALLTALPA